MINFIGQEKLINKLKSFTIDSFPRSTLIIGEKGCGKHTISRYLSDNIIKLPLMDITELINDEFIDNIHRSPNPYLYLIDLSIVTEKAQNTMLKFIEEPPINAFIILLAEHKNLVLNTIINRCFIFEFEQYSKDELLFFIEGESDADLITSILRTPGKIKSTNLKTFADAKDLCYKIMSRICDASYPNTLSISAKVNYKDEYDKIDVDVFFDLLCFLTVSQYQKTNNIKLLEMYKLTGEHRRALLDRRVNKKLLFEHYLSKLWVLMRGNNGYSTT